MPKVSMGTAQKEAELNRILIHKIHDVTERVTVGEISEKAGLSRNTLCTIRREPERLSTMQFGHVRRLAHIVGLSESEWLKLGGYK